MNRDKELPRKRVRIAISEDPRTGAVGGCCFIKGKPMLVYPTHHDNTMERIVKMFRWQWHRHLGFDGEYKKA